MVRELEQRLERSLEVRVTITKAIPHGAGLGGGSSDAAATLAALERLFDLDLSLRLRYEVAAAVGSDVPFFLYTAPQLAMGRGQVLKEVTLPALHLVVAVPGVALSTRTVYGWRDEDASVELKSGGRWRATFPPASSAPPHRTTWPRWSTTTWRPAWCAAARPWPTCWRACARKAPWRRP